MSRNLLVCCDGTWNDAEQTAEAERSNVWRFLEIAAPIRGETNKYFRGVGTGDLQDRLKGGIWGFGIGRSICEAYGWLAKKYQPGDNIFLVGFSRGAFTVRSLAGMIGCRGLNTRLAGLEPDAYRKGVAAEYEAYRARATVEHPAPNIHFVGVFDTVGKLGVPDSHTIANWFDQPQHWAFHNTQLGAHVIHGRHALAIDERRAAFMPTLWESSTGKPVYDFNKGGRTVKQLWFCGQHSDIGGGANQPATNMALHWMLQEAKNCGLQVDDAAMAKLELDVAAKLTDSSGRPLKIMPRSVPLLEPFHVDKLIHASVTARRNKDANYWPTRPLKAAPTSTVVEAGKGQEWQPTGVWVKQGQTLVAKTASRLGENHVAGYVANGRNPKIDGTWPEHEPFALNETFTVKNGGGYVYFRVLRQPVAHKKTGNKLMWKKLTVTLEQQ